RYKSVNSDFLCGIDNGFACDVGIAERDIIVNRIGEQKHILEYDCDLTTKRRQCVIFDIVSVDADGPAFDFVKSVKQIDDGGFSSTCRTYDRNSFARFYIEV